jgi:DNA-binding Xre family transcriptional regulator
MTNSMMETRKEEGKEDIRKQMVIVLCRFLSCFVHEIIRITENDFLLMT